ncbi:hypothetical protein Droror1_Dr00000010 [Drosera rotundifolia]
MDVNQAGGNAMQYTMGDVSKLWSFSPIFNGVQLRPPRADVMESPSSMKPRQEVRNLLQFAEKCLHEADYYHGIEACNEVLDGCGSKDPSLVHDCLCTRAALLLKRKWKNDAHMAVKDLTRARKINSSSFGAIYYMSEALMQLGKHKAALDFAVAAQSLAPSSFEVAERIEAIQAQLAAGEAKKHEKANGGVQEEARARKVISLSDILYRSDAYSDALQDGSRSEREDSDYDEELELDFETAVSGDEGHEADSNVLHGSFNLRVHRKPGVAASNGSSDVPSSSSRNDKATYQVLQYSFLIV